MEPLSLRRRAHQLFGDGRGRSLQSHKSQVYNTDRSLDEAEEKCICTYQFFSSESDYGEALSKKEYYRVIMIDGGLTC